MKVPITIGSYQAKSLVAEAQRAVNLYAERNPPDSPFPISWYPTPGKTLLGTASPTLGNGWRGLWWAANQKLYGVCGASVYSISSSWGMTRIGTLASSSGPVYMVDNANYLVIVDGSSKGWTVDLSNDDFAILNTDGFTGGSSANFVDGYLIFNIPNTREWYISKNDEISFDATLFASKSSYSDPLIGIGVTKRYVYLFGSETTEIWFDAGDTPFPFDRLPGAFMQYGCASPSSICQIDGNIYWLGQMQQGTAMIFRTNQFNAEKISTFALDNQMDGYTDLGQATGYTYEFEGHLFYVLNFPVSDVTWQFDISTGQWSQLAWCDSDGNLHRDRGNCFASAYGQPVIGDWENGNLYLLDANNYTDNGSPQVRIRSFPHAVDESSNRIHYSEFIANMEVGNGLPLNNDVPVFLRWSDTRGSSWGNPVQRTLGKQGDYVRSVQWRRLGMARDRVFEVSWSAPVKTSIMGAWVEAQSNNT